MGDFRIVIDGSGNHGCGRQAKDGDVVTRCGEPHCVDCQAKAFAAQLRGASIATARLEHWPVPGAAGTTRNADPGPIDDLISGVRHGSFVQPPAPALLKPGIVVTLRRNGCDEDAVVSRILGNKLLDLKVGEIELGSIPHEDLIAPNQRSSYATWRRKT